MEHGGEPRPNHRRGAHRQDGYVCGRPFLAELNNVRQHHHQARRRRAGDADHYFIPGEGVEQWHNNVVLDTFQLLRDGTVMFRPDGSDLFVW